MAAGHHPCMPIRVDPRALVLSALLATPGARALADDAGVAPAPPRPNPVCRARVCPDWGTSERERVHRRDEAPPAPTPTPPSATGSGS